MLYQNAGRMPGVLLFSSLKTWIKNPAGLIEINFLAGVAAILDSVRAFPRKVRSGFPSGHASKQRDRAFLRFNEKQKGFKNSVVGQNRYSRHTS